MFWNLLSSSISLATVTPSLVTVGEPQDFSMTTLRPRGPRVTLTASASVLTPCRISSRAADLKMISLAAIFVDSLVLDHAEDLFLAQNEVLDSVDLDLLAAVTADQDVVALLHQQRMQLAFVVNLAGADSNHLALHRLLFGRVGNDDSTLGLLFLGDPLDEQAILQRLDLHLGAPPEVF